MSENSKIIYSKKFKNIINKMKHNTISKKILNLDNSYVEDLKYNFIDITDENNRLLFTPEKKVKDILSKKNTFHVINQEGRYLTHSYLNDKVFELLGYDKTQNNELQLGLGTLGNVLKEVESPISGKIYCLFEDLNKSLSVINKEALKKSVEKDYNKVWSTSRNKINVGRLVRSILKSSNLEFTTKELEVFVNLYKATYDFMSDKLNHFDIVKGCDISYWYKKENYSKGKGVLNNSCMAESEESFFDIYCDNKNVNLVILYDDGGIIKDNKYSSNKIKGRALLWDCKFDGKNIKFMDRIYTNNDSDVDLFKKYAEKNGFWYKSSQSMEADTPLFDGEKKRLGVITCDLEFTKHKYYPYMDTLSFISRTGGFCSNYEDGCDIRAVETDGEYYDL